MSMLALNYETVIDSNNRWFNSPSRILFCPSEPTQLSQLVRRFGGPPPWPNLTHLGTSRDFLPYRQNWKEAFDAHSSICLERNIQPRESPQWSPVLQMYRERAGAEWRLRGKPMHATLGSGRSPRAPSVLTERWGIWAPQKPTEGFWLFCCYPGAYKRKGESMLFQKRRQVKLSGVVKDCGKCRWNNWGIKIQR